MRRSRFSLAEKLNLAFVAVFSVPLVVLSLFLGWKFEHDRKDQAEAAVQARLERTAEVVSRKTEVLESVASTLAAARSLLDVAVRRGSPSAADMLAVKEQLPAVDRIQTLNPEVVRTRFFLENPDWPEVWPFLYSEDRLRPLPWHDPVAEGRTVWRLGHWDDLTFRVETMSQKDRLVSLFKRLDDPYGEPLGSLQVSTTVDAFFDGLFDHGAPPAAALWDPREGTVRDLWDRPLPPSLAETPARLGVAPATSGLLSPGGGDPAVAWRALPHLGVVLLAEVPRAPTETLVPVQGALAAGTLAVLALAALLFAFGTRLVLRRLEAVSAAVRQVRRGHWDVDLPVTGNDEVAELSQTFRDLLQRLRELVDGVVREQVAAKDAELRALQSQINAHFLYNALEAIRMTAFVDGQDRVADALAALGRTLRYGMEWDRPVVTLQEEVAHAEAYILLWNLRFGGGLAWETDLAAGWEEWPAVKFTLQPLVENAVVHGLAGRRHRGRLRLEARTTGGFRELTVRDDGAGQTELRWDEVRRGLDQPTGEPSGSIGLSNVHERLRKTFGRSAGLVIGGSAGGWTTVTARWPAGEEAK